MTDTGDKKEQGGGLDLQQQVNFLKKIEFFNNFDNHELRQFLAVTRWLKAPRGMHIIQENTMERVFYILVKGQVSVIKTVAGREAPIVLSTLPTGACFGEMSLVMDVRRTAGVVADVDSFILMVEPAIISTSNVFLQLKFYKRFCEILVSRLISANEKVARHEMGAAPAEPEAAPPPARMEPSRAEEEARPATTPAPPPPRPAVSDETALLLPSMPAKKDRIIKKRLQRRLTTSTELPVNPAVARDIEPYLAGDYDNTRLLADKIHLDPALSCKVLQVANSSYFRMSASVATVPHAMITIGIKQVQEALLESVVASRRLKAFSGFRELSRSYWHHSVLVGRIATLLKDLIRLNMSSDVYLAGLLHDVGILALDPIEPAFYPNLAGREGEEIKQNLCEAESLYIGLDHGQAGAAYGEAIGLPEACLAAMRFHHSPLEAREHPLICALIHIADCVAVERGYAVGGAGYPLSPLVHSAGWIIIQEQHKPFLDVNLSDFTDSFNRELDNTWSGLTSGLSF